MATLSLLNTLVGIKIVYCTSVPQSVSLLSRSLNSGSAIERNMTNDQMGRALQEA